MKAASTRKSKQSDYSKALKTINSTIFYYKNKVDQTDQHLEKVHNAELSRLILKLTPRECDKFYELLKLLDTHPHYDTREKIINFNRDDYIQWMGFKKDENL